MSSYDNSLYIMDHLWVGDQRLSGNQYATPAVFRDSLRSLQSQPVFAQKEIGNSTHFLCREIGLEIEFSHDQLHSIFYYILHGGMTYTGPLPFGINTSMIMKDVLTKFGEASEKRGGKIVEVELAYSHLGMDIVFNTKNWQTPQATMSYLVLYQALGSKFHCGLCCKPALMKCECGHVMYCGQNCRQAFAKAHHSFCKA